MSDFDLTRARLNKGLSQRQAALEIGIDRDTLRRLEQGTGSAHPAKAKLVADFFDVEVTDLLPVGRAA